MIYSGWIYYSYYFTSLISHSYYMTLYYITNPTKCRVSVECRVPPDGHSTDGWWTLNTRGIGSVLKLTGQLIGLLPCSGDYSEISPLDSPYLYCITANFWMQENFFAKLSYHEIFLFYSILQKETKTLCKR